jgi:1,4-dihydroxy-2-naphthoate octaprenyltransferase
MGGFLAGFVGKYEAKVTWLCVLTTLFLQILSNLANDYGDSVHGADSIYRQGPRRTIQAGQISPQAMFRAIILCSLFALASGLSLLVVAVDSWQTFAVFLGLGLLAIAAAISYTMGKKPYGYAGLGDIAVFIFFGWVAVLGTFYLQTKTWDWAMLLPASSCGFLAMAVLNVNNIRDIDSDKLAGKHSIPVRIGRVWAVRYHYFLLCAGFFCAFIFTDTHYEKITQNLYFLTVPLFVINARAVTLKTNPTDLDPYLRQLAIATLLFVLTFGMGHILPKSTIFP